MIIDSVFVEKDLRRRGIGTKLMKKAMDLAIMEEVGSVELVVNDDNKIAKGLYEKVGFEKTKKEYFRKILKNE